MEGRETLRIFGDPAYSDAFGTVSAFSDPMGRHALPANQAGWNASLSSAWIEVERVFGDVQKFWTYTAFGKAQRAGSQPVAAYYVVAVLLTNLLACLRGERQGNRFGLTPPSVESYLSIDD